MLEPPRRVVLRTRVARTDDHHAVRRGVALALGDEAATRWPIEGDAAPFGVPGVVHDLELDLAASAIEHLVARCAELRILDTALDAMALRLRGERTTFRLSRAAAWAGKVAFVLPGEVEASGTLELELEGERLGDWLEHITWHSGREAVPRSVGDDLAMDGQGEAPWIE